MLLASGCPSGFPFKALVPRVWEDKVGREGASRSAVLMDGGFSAGGCCDALLGGLVF